MTYKEYIKATIAIDKKYTSKRKAVADEIQKMEDSAMKSGRITPADEKQLTKLYEEAEFLKNKHNRSIYQLKLNFAKQDSKVKVGDIIWAALFKLYLDLSKHTFQYAYLVTTYLLSCG